MSDGRSIQNAGSAVDVAQPPIEPKYRKEFPTFSVVAIMLAGFVGMWLTHSSLILVVALALLTIGVWQTNKSAHRFNAELERKRFEESGLTCFCDACEGKRAAARSHADTSLAET